MKSFILHVQELFLKAIKDILLLSLSIIFKKIICHHGCDFIDLFNKIAS